MIAPSRIFLPLSLVWIISEIVLGGVKRSKSTTEDRDKRSLVILWTTIVVSIALGVNIALHKPGQFLFQSLAIPYCGIGLIILGLMLRWIAILSLGQLFTVDVAIMQGHRVIRTGIYKRVRHPSYSGALLSFLGLGLAFSNYYTLLVIFVPICAAFLYRIHIEERTLIAAFGNEYLDYCATTKRLIPWIY